MSPHWFTVTTTSTGSVGQPPAVPPVGEVAWVVEVAEHPATDDAATMARPASTVRRRNSTVAA